MALVTAAEVQTILGDDVDCGSLDSFIQTADLLVTEELASSGFSAARLKQIELYLSAHLATVSLEKGGLIRQKIGESDDYYQGWNNTGTGLQATRFGQQVSMLDSSGKLTAAASGQLKAQFRVVGKNPADCGI